MNTSFRSAIPICLGIIFLTTPLLSSAHPGRTAGDGCHYCRTNCDKWGEAWDARHCHNAPAAVPVVRQTPPPPAPDPEPDPYIAPVQPKPAPTTKSEPTPTSIQEETHDEIMEDIFDEILEELSDPKPAANTSAQTTSSNEELSGGELLTPVIAILATLYWSYRRAKKKKLVAK